MSYPKQVRKRTFLYRNKYPPIMQHYYNITIPYGLSECLPNLKLLPLAIGGWDSPPLKTNKILQL